MGLDTSHGCWNGSYGNFSWWRTAIAKCAGIELKQMVGFGGKKSWDDYEGDVIVELLNHSDCDSGIPAAVCSPLADRLEELLPKVKETEDDDSEYLVEKTVTFIRGLRLAASMNENVEFH